MKTHCSVNPNSEWAFSNLDWLYVYHDTAFRLQNSKKNAHIHFTTPVKYLCPICKIRHKCCQFVSSNMLLSFTVNSLKVHITLWPLQGRQFPKTGWLSILSYSPWLNFTHSSVIKLSFTLTVHSKVDHAQLFKTLSLTLAQITVNYNLDVYCHILAENFVEW